MRPLYWGLTALVVLIAACYFGWGYASQPSTPTRLERDALSAVSLSERSHAVIELSMRKDSETRLALRRLAAESQDPEVQVVALDTLANMNDMASLPIFIAAMDSPAESVRVVGYRAALRYYGGTLPERLRYNVKDTPEQRGRVTSKLAEIYQSPPPQLH